MKNKIFKFLIIAFAILFLVFPISFVIFHNLLLSLIICAFILIVYQLFHLKIKIKLPQNYVPYILFGIAFLTRLICVLLLNDKIVYVSDFGRAFENATIMNFQDAYYRVFTHWILISEITHYIFNILGNSQLVALIFNCFVVSGIAVLIYLIIKQIKIDYRVGIIASLIYIFWPSMLLYVTIFTPDHLASLLILFSIYLFFKFYNHYKIRNWFMNTFYAIIIGIILGLSTFFKNIGLVIIISIILFISLNYFKNNSFKELLKQLMYGVIILLSFILSKNILFLHIENLVGNSVGRNIAPCYLNVGLNSISKGSYNDEVYQMYFDELINTNYNYDLTNQKILKALKVDIKNNLVEFPKLIYHKGVIILQNDNDKIKWVSESIPSINSTIFDKIIVINQVYYILIIIFVGLTLIGTIKAKNVNIIMIFICIFGTFLLLLLIEAQARYRYVIEPLLCMLAGISIFDLIRSDKNEKLY